MKISGMQNEAPTEEENTAGPSASADRVRKGILKLYTCHINTSKLPHSIEIKSTNIT